MVHGREPGQIEVGRLPELLGEVEIERFPGGFQPVSRDDEPLARVRGRLVDAVEEEAGRGPAEDVRHEMPARAVVGVEEGAGPLQLLDLAQHRLHRRVERVLRHAIGPDDPDHVRAAAGTEPDARDGPRRDPVHVEVLRAGLDLGAVAEPVDLGRAGGQALERDVDPAVRIAPAILEERDGSVGQNEGKIEVPVSVGIDGLRGADGGQRSDVRGGEAAGPVVAIQRRRPLRRAEKEIEETVVVVVEEQRNGSGADRPRGPETAVAAVERHEGARLSRPDEIHASVAVQIAGGGGEDHARLRKPRLAHGKTSAPQVVVEDESALLPSEQQIHVAVAIEVRGDREARCRSRGDAGRRGDVGPGPVEVVAQQVIARPRRHVQVQVAVGVHVERDDPLARGRRDALGAFPIPNPQRSRRDEIQRARVGDVRNDEVHGGGPRNRRPGSVAGLRGRGDAQALRSLDDEVPGVLPADAHGGGARQGIQARVRLSHERDRDRPRRAGAQRSGERGAPVLERQAHDAGVDVVARGLVARRRAQDVLGDLVLERRRAGIAGLECALALRERLVEFRLARDEGRQPVRRRNGPGRVPVRAVQLDDAHEQEHVRGRLSECGLQVPDRAAAGRFSHLRLEPGRVPQRGDVPRREGGGLPVAFDRSRPVAGELAPRALEREHARLVGREPERLGHQARRQRFVLRAHRGDGTVGPTERLGGRQLPDRLELHRRLGEIALFERGETDIAGRLELQRAGRRRRRRSRGNRHREQQAEDAGHRAAVRLSGSRLTPSRRRGPSRRPRRPRRRGRRTRSSGRIRNWARTTAPRRR